MRKQDKKVEKKVKEIKLLYGNIRPPICFNGIAFTMFIKYLSKKYSKTTEEE